MRTVAIINAKGGTGKTTTALALAEMFALRHQKQVLCIDADTQHNLTEKFSVTESNALTTLLAGSMKDVDLHRVEDSIWLVPSGYSLYEVELSGALSIGKFNLEAIKEFVEAWAENHYGDICLIDCPPHLTPSSVAAITAADTILIPTSPDRYSVYGMMQLIEQIQNLKGGMDELREGGIFLTMWENKQPQKEIEMMLKQNGWPVLDAHIRRSPKVVESTWASEASVTIFSPRSSAAKDYMALSDLLAKKWGWTE